MIDIRDEAVVSLKDACSFFPARRRGKRPAFQTLLRWAMKGVGGRRLEVVKVGNCLCTSRGAVARFVEGMTRDDERLTPAGPSIRTPAARQRAIKKADDHLRREGVVGDDK